ncbi:phosphoribosylanthranilate isomerase [Adhaeribacter radiodurans]|uniref:N-(5'-phosphoribosyl)anthranilate isomerase n=1 Tax=Adhaeribacter radiodurans TaxID=2745197 RepID=A0A7L7L6J4_9BACT|nr:phosphoribosylanthranilate isomerase [Adhaeribacter radiodurans]QMU28427.1 phosphoribosylanthranilate isomerase [Adhaeribacter radiodurans]
MALITSVIVNSINNLSDARYCAGMGVDMLGFCLDESQPNYISSQEIKEIAGWVAGVQLVGEFKKATVEQINALTEACQLDYVQLEKQYLIDEIQQINCPVIQRARFTKDTIESELIEEMHLYKDHVASFLIFSDDYQTIDETNIRFLQDLARDFKIIIGFGISKENVNEVLQIIKPDGIALKGGQEIKPGLKDFDKLQEIFEELEEV